MKKYIALILITVLILTAFAWSAAASRDYYSVSEHKDEATLTGGETDAVNVKTYQGIKTALYSFVKDGREKGYLNISDYDGNVSDAVSEASLEIIHSTALGAYALENITHSLSKEFSYYNVEVNIIYKHTKEQIKGIMNLNYVSAVQGALGKALSEHNEYLVISISSEQVTPEYLKAYALEYYRSNPLSVIALPALKTVVYGKTELPKILEIEISYPNSFIQDAEMKARLQSAASALLKNAKSSKDLVSAANACSRLNASSIYLMSAGPTAYSALVDGMGNSEAFAMSYKLLCSILGVRCSVVEGTYNGEKHFWNLIELGGEYYHADPAISDLIGMSLAFMKNDVEMEAMNYRWDKTKYKPSIGNMKYEPVDNIQ